MASALLANRNELSWGERNMHMKKNKIHNSKHGILFADKNYDNETPTTTARSAVVAVSENSTSLDRVAFRIANCSEYSGKERRELRQRLELELKEVRKFTSTVESRFVGPEMEKLVGAMMKKCGQILSKVMKQKKSVWFNSPVDAVRMGLHDYFHIVKKPMDLGTVKSKLSKGVYALPVEFADDIRLTFNNALIYNPQCHEVHKLAVQYLNLFESLFEPAYNQYQRQIVLMGKDAMGKDDGHVNYNKSMSDASMRSEPPKRKVPTPPTMQAMSSPHMQASRTQSLVQHQWYPADRIMEEKHPPEAKDLNKRQMSFEEKQNLGTALESLPHEKMAQVLQIVSKRNAARMQNGDDEIELDIEAIDPETLWELDQFVNNCKKAMTKMRRQEDARAVAPGDRFNKASKRSKKLEIADDDVVDIGDEMPPPHYPTVEIEKNVGDSSSSSSDSSSSDDSGSSSGSDSDDAQSPG